ncbi:MAG TPA: family 43 glycosylhydrolase [Pyrinomonadaceae bacterium]|nr:family 43 glycosylhydrolase [Pyrinomonadaceae bacterium]
MNNKRELTLRKKDFSFSRASVYLWAILVLLSLSAGVQAQPREQHQQQRNAATYTNPVLAGDYPDPSVIRVGKDYYATATSSEWAPEFPILHSRDLVNWTIVGTVFPTRPSWSVGNYWAPEIWQENGKIYILYTARRAGGPLCIAVATAAKPTGPYTDHGALECQEVGSIDAFPIRDENGKLFVVWKEDGNSVGKPTPLWAQQLDEKTFKLVGERREILRNDAPWEANLVEGPYIMRRNGWFYMFYAGNACCGRECNYAAGVARSKTLLGKWEKNPANPILKGNEHWKCPGHGTIVTDERGRTFLMYHAYDPKDTVYVGRQALLDEVTWTGDDWAVINGGNGPSKQANAPLGIGERNAEYRFFDDFTSRNLRFGWQWLHAIVPNYRLNNGWLVLSPKPEHARNEIGAMMGWSTTLGNYEATTQLDTRNPAKDAIAGISAFGDNENALGMGVQNGKLVIWKRERNNHQVILTADAPKSKQLYLRMEALNGHLFRFAVSRDNRKWQVVGGEVDGAYLPPWDRGLRVALVSGGAANASARFGFLRIEPLKITMVESPVSSK